MIFSAVGAHVVGNARELDPLLFWRVQSVGSAPVAVPRLANRTGIHEVETVVRLNLKNAFRVDLGCASIGHQESSLHVGVSEESDVAFQMRQIAARRR